MELPSKEQVAITKNKRIELLFSQGLDASLSGILVALIFSLLMFSESNNFDYMVWAIINIFVSSVRYILCKSFLDRQIPYQAYNRWAKYYFMSAIIAGLAWGGLLLINIRDLGQTHQLLTFMTLAYIIFGMVATYSAILRTITYSLIAMLIMITIGLIFIQGENYYKIIVLFWLALPFGFSTSKKFNQIIIQSLTHQLQAEKLNSQLEISHLQLEDKVVQRTKDLVVAKESAEQAKQASSEFLANMTHELRTPLHAILSFSKLGSRKKMERSPEKRADYFNKIHYSGERLLELMENLLELSKYDAGKADFNITANSLTSIIKETCHDLNVLIEDKSLQLDCQLPKKDVVALFDKLRIEQVIKNLLGNAIKFSPKNCTISIKLEYSEMVVGRRDTDTNTTAAIKFSVSDQGMGIPDEELNVIFDKFIQSTKTKTGAGGTGLGLAICKEVVDGHNGKIWATNNSKQGASFHFTIPLLEE